MKKNIITLASLLLILVFSCGEKSTSTAKDGTDSTGKACLAPSDRNPNGASELASLMRVMEEQTEIWKKEILENTPALSPVPESFSTLKTASVTDADMKNENFDGFADDFISYANTLVASKPEDRKTAFNSLVGGCMTCHTQMCPGPIKRINKFYFE
ncbi:MAG: hypothetical protein MH137_11590 [Flavobacteriales bacterium]|nr:hypothetical protein [Flavobacteriales bacterium]